MKTLQPRIINVFIIVVFMSAIFLRLYLYSDPRLSIGTNDTESYVNSSRANLLSWASLSGRRLFTTNLFFKMANNSENCQPSQIGNPRIKDGQLQMQACFDKITLAQTALSIFSWCLLAWTTSRRMTRTLAKFTATFLILAFGFTPQLVEWDNILGAESLSLSLFALSFSFLLEIVYLISDENEQINRTKFNLVVIGWLVIFTLWVFIRDVHIYATLITVILVVPLFMIRRIRETKILIVICCTLVGLFLVGYVSSRQSPRWQPSLTHVLDQYIFPYPARVEIFEKYGMPARDSSTYNEWFNSQGIKTYGLFLLSHPGFVISTILDQFFYFEEDTIQEYYKTPAGDLRLLLISIGHILHPKSVVIYLIDMLMLVSICSVSIRQGDLALKAWAWLSIWLFLCAFVTLFVSFFGDTAGTGRHLYPSIEMFRLFGWIFLTLHIDRFNIGMKNSTLDLPALKKETF